MDVAALEKMITDDKAAGKTPAVVIAYAGKNGSHPIYPFIWMSRESRILMKFFHLSGTPLVGHTDNIQKLQELCKANDMWLHLEGYLLFLLRLFHLFHSALTWSVFICVFSSNNLAALTLFSVPTAVVPAKSGDSLSLNLGGWLGLPAVPHVVSLNFPIQE